MKKEKRGFFETIFGKKEGKTEKTFSGYKLLNGYEAYFTNWGKNVYDSKVARTAIDRIATQAAKLTPKHIQGSVTNHIKGDINYLLSNKPNPIMTTYDFLYKITSQLYTYNNAFIYIQKDSRGFIKGFYPILSYEDKLLQDKSGKVFLKFNFYGGKSYTLPYTDLIHLRRFYNEDDYWGSSNKCLGTDLETAHTSSEGINNAIQTSNNLKGILAFQGMLKPEDIKANRDKFVEDFLHNGNKSGIAALDSKATFQNIEVKPITLDDKQLQKVNDNIYDYFGVSEDIIRNDYTPDKWNAFFEGVIEPLSIQLEQAFTNAIFNEQAIRLDGNRIIFTTHRLQYASLDQKIELVKTLASFGLLRKDEAREVLELAPLGGDEGEKILQSLNNIDSTIANQYQGGEE